MGKEYRISARLEDWQYRELLRQIRADPKENKNMSAHIRYLITEKVPNMNPEIRGLLKRILYQQCKIGTNINQIVKHHNSNFYQPDDKNRLFEYMELLKEDYQELLQTLNRISDDLIRREGGEA